MATRTIYATASGNSGDLKDGGSFTYSSSTGNSGVVSGGGTINSATLKISSIKTYTKYGFYFDVYVGGTKVAETVEIKDQNDSSHSITVDLEYIKSAILTATGSIKFIVYNNGSSSSTTCNFRSGGTATITVNYTPPVTTITPTAPTITWPAAASKTTYNTKPWFRFKANANTTKLYWRVDSGSWQNFSASNGSSYDKQWTTALSAGSHTVYCYALSSTSTSSSTVSRAFTVASPQAAVTAGSAMDDATIDGLQTNIRNQQAYYGQTQTTFTTCDYGTSALDDHIDQMEVAIEALPHPTSLSSVDAGSSITAATINAIRTALTNA